MRLGEPEEVLSSVAIYGEVVGNLTTAWHEVAIPSPTPLKWTFEEFSHP